MESAATSLVLLAGLGVAGGFGLIIVFLASFNTAIREFREGMRESVEQFQKSIALQEAAVIGAMRRATAAEFKLREGYSSRTKETEEDTEYSSDWLRAE